MWRAMHRNGSTLPVRASIASLTVPASPTSFYKRSNFVTHLPVDRLYSPSHFWLERMENSRWRVGFTKFATRMLGEIVDATFEKPAGAAIASGEIIGAIEGFKAISDIYCVADGTFAGANPALQENIALVGEKPYAEGWLYEFDGTPDAKCSDLASYQALLDATIDRMLAKQSTHEPENP
jgi:glycine cleavage system H protein